MNKQELYAAYMYGLIVNFRANAMGASQEEIELAIKLLEDERELVGANLTFGENMEEEKMLTAIIEYLRVC